MCQPLGWILHVPMKSDYYTHFLRKRPRVREDRWLTQSIQVADVVSIFQPRPPESLLFSYISFVLSHILSWSVAPGTNYFPIAGSSMLLACVSLPIREDTVALLHPEWLQGTQENRQGSSFSLKVNPECKLWILVWVQVTAHTCCGKSCYLSGSLRCFQSFIILV